MTLWIFEKTRGQCDDREALVIHKSVSKEIVPHSGTLHISVTVVTMSVILLNCKFILEES